MIVDKFQIATRNNRECSSGIPISPTHRKPTHFTTWASASIAPRHFRKRSRLLCYFKNIKLKYSSQYYRQTIKLYHFIRLGDIGSMGTKWFSATRTRDRSLPAIRKFNLFSIVCLYFQVRELRVCG